MTAIRIITRILAGLLLLAALVLLGVFAYQAGFAHGAAADLESTIVQWGIPVLPFAGLTIGGLLLFVLLMFVVLGALRHLFWGPTLHRRYPPRGIWHEAWKDDEVPPAFQEWHRKAHAADNGENTPPGK